MVEDGLEKKEVDSHTYSFSKYGAKESLKVLTRLTRIIGEPLAIGMAAASGKKSGKSLLDTEIDPDIIGKAVRALVDRLDEDEVMGLIEKLTSVGVLCDGKKINFDVHYNGKLPHLFKVLWAAIEVQYGNFFDELTEKLDFKPIQNSTQAPTT